MKEGETDKKTVRKTLCSQDFILSGVIVPMVEELPSLCHPAGHQRNKPDIQTTVHTVETFGRVQHRQTCQHDCILARKNTCLISKLQCLSVLIFTWFFIQYMASTVEKVILSTVHARNFN